MFLAAPLTRKFTVEDFPKFFCSTKDYIPGIQPKFVFDCIWDGFYAILGSHQNLEEVNFVSIFSLYEYWSNFVIHFSNFPSDYMRWFITTSWNRDPKHKLGWTNYIQGMAANEQLHVALYFSAWQNFTLFLASRWSLLLDERPNLLNSNRYHFAMKI